MVSFVIRNSLEPWRKLSGSTRGRLERKSGRNGLPHATSDKRVQRQLVCSRERRQRREVKRSRASGRPEMPSDPERDAGMPHLVFRAPQLRLDELARCTLRQ